MVRSIGILFSILLVGIFSISLDTLSPPASIGPFLNGLFPNSTPSEGGSWELEDPLPGVIFQSPVRVLPLPNHSDILVLGKFAEIWRVSLEHQTKSVVLDIKDRSFKGGEAGACGMALHPKFGDPSAPDQQLLFLFYRTKPDPDGWDEKGFNRLSKFTWDPQSERFDPDSEEILIQQYDRSTWHNGGGMFFGKDEFLYVSFGDEGREEDREISTQKLTGGFFSGVIRIDVDNDASRSHPIIRQPIANHQPPNGWGATYSQGYSIPNDNPWLSPDGNHLEEFYALGVRSPYSMTYDSETETIWLADVGGKREELNQVEKGDNLEWPYMEGQVPSEMFQRPAQVIGNPKKSYFEYDRTIGSCIIGGNVYHGTKFPELNGKFLFADYIRNKIMTLTNTGSNTAPAYERILSLNEQSIDLPETLGITGIFSLKDGAIVITVKGDDLTEEGKIYRLKRKADVPEPPAKLSELGAFTDLSSLSPAPGIIPYRVNAPLWSDRAEKKRWMAIPNDGIFDSAEEQIRFQETGEWEFPVGTVFIKHFELPMSNNGVGESIRLETRFFIIGKDGIGYGLTYKWNSEGTEATLLGGGASRDFDINEEDEFAFTQTWDFPSREQCMSCHNPSARFVLGVKTHQLNGNLYYPELGREMNQLEYLNDLGVFQRDIGHGDDYPRAFSIDDESADLELRIRSYLDANCAACHRLNEVPTTKLDLRFNIPLYLQDMINSPTNSSNSDPNRLIVKPGFHESSELWVRDASSDENRMPPIGRNLVDQVYVDALAEWIGQLSPEAGTLYKMLLFPNPTTGTFSIRFRDDWPLPVLVNIKNVAGQSIYQETFDAKIVELQLADLPAGLYLVEMLAGENRHTEKIILQ